MRLVVEADGGSRGNPGPAGYGAVVRDAATGAVLARRNGFLGTRTNNVAEYRGLIAGLTAATELDGQAEVAVRMDSKLVVEQMSGRWQVKHPDMRPLAREASALVAGLGRVHFTWIPRAQNGDADKLANEAMDARRSTYDALDDTPLDDTLPDDTLPDDTRLPAEPVAPGWGDPQPGPPTRLVLLRHAQTALSAHQRFSGLGDPPLTALGRVQAALAAGRLAAAGDFDAIITSPLARARQTADAAGKCLQLRPFVDEDWRECDFGEFEGLTFTEARARHPRALQAWLEDPEVAPPGGESFAQVTSRVQGALARLRSAAGQRVLVVSHVSPIKVAAQLALAAPAMALRTLHLDLASLTRIDLQADGTAVVRGWNDAAHLEELTSTAAGRAG